MKLGLAGGMLALFCGSAAAQQGTPAYEPPVLKFDDSCAKPQWPKAELERGYTGKVLLSFLVNEEGRAIDSRIVKTSGSDLLDEAAKVLQTCQFRPARRNGVVVGAWMPIHYYWTLETEQLTQARNNKQLALRQKALAGDMDALYELGMMYWEESEVRDQKLAVQLFQPAAQRGQAQAQYQLGIALYLGLGITRDVELGLGWLRRAAEQGNVEAQQRLGMHYSGERSDVLDPVQAAFWYSKAAEQGAVVAQEKLATAYARGAGVPASSEQALRWYRKAAENGSALGQTRLGQAYLTGQETDAVQARKWLEQAAQQRWPEAEATLGELYLAGAVLPQSDAQGWHYLQRGMAGGDAGALALAGYLLTRGRHIAQDLPRGQKLLQQAQQLGEPRAAAWLAGGSTPDASLRY